MSSDDDFLVIQELMIGDAIRRQVEITRLMTEIDVLSDEFMPLMKESTELMQRILEFQVSYNEGLTSGSS